MAALHARAFADVSRPWSAAEIAQLCADPVVFAAICAAGFALGRAAGGEAELLTLAVDRHARRQGFGRALLARFEEGAAARGAGAVFLEVAVTNLAARGLYFGAGYAAAGVRPRYLRDARGAMTDALMLRKNMRRDAALADTQIPFDPSGSLSL